MISCFVTNYRERGIFEYPAPLMWITLTPSHLQTYPCWQMWTVCRGWSNWSTSSRPAVPLASNQEPQHPQSAPGLRMRTSDTLHNQTPDSDTGDRGRRRINEKFTSRLPVAALSNSSDSATPLRAREGGVLIRLDTINKKTVAGLNNIKSESRSHPAWP